MLCSSDVHVQGTTHAGSQFPCSSDLGTNVIETPWVAESILSSSHLVRRHQGDINTAHSTCPPTDTSYHHATSSTSHLARMSPQRTSDSDTMSGIAYEGPLHAVANRSEARASPSEESCSATDTVIDDLSEPPTRRKQRMYPCLKTHRYSRGTKL